MKFSGTSVSGVIGEKDSVQKVRGWEHFTTGTGGDVKVRLGHQQGVPSFDHNTVSIDEPLRLGRFIGVWTRTVPFFSPIATNYWNYFFQDKLLEVSGINDNTLSVMERKMGAVQRTEKYIGYYEETNGTFTLKVPEVKGSPVRKLLQYYMSGMSDPTTGVAHYHGNKDLRHNKVNYSGDFLYILLGPSMRPDDIEFACMWVNAFPNIDLLSHLNSGTIGDAGGADKTFDVEFNGSYIHNDSVNRMAQVVTEAFGLYKDTKEDVILPNYMYKDILADGKAADLKDKYGASLEDKLAAMSKLKVPAATSYIENEKSLDGALVSSITKPNEDLSTSNTVVTETAAA